MTKPLFIVDVSPFALAGVSPEDTGFVVVTSGADSGPGSLRDIAANLSGQSVILFDSSVFAVTITTPLTISVATEIEGKFARVGVPNVILGGTGHLLLANAEILGNFTVGGSLLLRNNGTVDQNGDIVIGDATNGPAQVTNAPGHTWKMDDKINILGGNANATFNNAGTFECANLVDDFTSFGAQLINNSSGNGVIKIDNGVLIFASPAGNNFDRQTIEGTQIFVERGINTIGLGTELLVSSVDLTATTMKLDSALSYAGSLSMYNSTLDTQSSNLTVSGQIEVQVSTLIGSGKIIIGGAKASEFIESTIGGSVLVRDNGTVVQDGPITLGDSSNGAAQITVAKGAVWTMEGFSLNAGSTNAVINLGGGTLVYTVPPGGASPQFSVLGANIEDLAAMTSAQSFGVIEDKAGTLDLRGTIGYGVNLKLDGGTTMIIDAPAQADAILSAGSVLQIDDTAHYFGYVNGFDSTDTIDIASVGAGGARVGYAEFRDGTSQVTVANATQSAAVLLNATYDASKFHLRDDGHGGTNMTYG